MDAPSERDESTMAPELESCTLPSAICFVFHAQRPLVLTCSCSRSDGGRMLRFSSSIGPSSYPCLNVLYMTCGAVTNSPLRRCHLLALERGQLLTSCSTAQPAREAWRLWSATLIPWQSLKKVLSSRLPGSLLPRTGGQVVFRALPLAVYYCFTKLRSPVDPSLMPTGIPPGRKCQTWPGSASLAWRVSAPGAGRTFATQPHACSCMGLAQY